MAGLAGYADVGDSALLAEWYIAASASRQISRQCIVNRTHPTEIPTNTSPTPRHLTPPTHPHPIHPQPRPTLPTQPIRHTDRTIARTHHTHIPKQSPPPCALPTQPVPHTPHTVSHCTGVTHVEIQDAGDEASLADVAGVAGLAVGDGAGVADAGEGVEGVGGGARDAKAG